MQQNQQSSQSEDRLPYDLAAEEVVVGAVCKGYLPASRTIYGVSVEKMLSPENSSLVTALADTVGESGEVNIVGAAAMLGSKKKAAKSTKGWISILVSTIELCPSENTARHALAVVLNCYRIRALVMSARGSIAVANSGAPFTDVHDEYLKGLAGVTMLAYNAAIHVGDVSKEVIERIGAASRGEVLPGIETGFVDVDQKIGGGMKLGDLVICAGRPSMGKTAFMSNVAANVSRSGGGVLFFSSEMEAKSLVHRVLCSEAKVSATAAWRGKVSDDDKDRLAECRDAMAKTRFWIDDTNGIDVTSLTTKATAMHSSKGLSLVVVDYLQMIESGRHLDDRRSEVSYVVAQLKRLARRLNIPVLVGCQISRGVEKRRNKYPTLADMKEAGKIEEDADVIMALYRKDVYAKDKNLEAPGCVADLFVLKNRNGPTGNIELYYAKSFMKFENLEKEESDEKGEGKVPGMPSEPELPF